MSRKHFNKRKKNPQQGNGIPSIRGLAKSAALAALGLTMGVNLNASNNGLNFDAKTGASDQLRENKTETGVFGQRDVYEMLRKKGDALSKSGSIYSPIVTDRNADNMEKTNLTKKKKLKAKLAPPKSASTDKGMDEYTMLGKTKYAPSQSAPTTGDKGLSFVKMLSNIWNGKNRVVPDPTIWNGKNRVVPDSTKSIAKSPIKVENADKVEAFGENTVEAFTRSRERSYRSNNSHLLNKGKYNPNLHNVNPLSSGVDNKGDLPLVMLEDLKKSNQNGNRWTNGKVMALNQNLVGDDLETNIPGVVNNDVKDENDGKNKAGDVPSMNKMLNLNVRTTDLNKAGGVNKGENLTPSSEISDISGSTQYFTPPSGASFESNRNESGRSINEVNDNPPHIRRYSSDGLSSGSNYYTVRSGESETVITPRSEVSPNTEKDNNRPKTSRGLGNHNKLGKIKEENHNNVYVTPRKSGDRAKNDSNVFVNTGKKVIEGAKSPS